MKFNAIHLRPLPIYFYILLACIPVMNAQKSLQKGQVIKQFFAFSITQSLSRHPFQWFSTQLPCTPPRVWVEEPPVFHLLSALFLRIFSNIPQIVPILSFLLLGLGISSLIQSSFKKTFERWMVVGLLLYMPGVIKYSIQHLPDLLATAFLICGSALVLSNKRRLGLFLWMLSVTTKALTLFAIVPILVFVIFYDQNSDQPFLKKLLNIALTLLCISFPFLLWVLWIQIHPVPSPFWVSNVIENRHSGRLKLLIESAFYLRSVTWIGIKGVGLFLFLPFLAYGWSHLRATQKSFKASLNPQKLRLEKVLLFWSVGVVPYWLLVRQGNFVHDYYSLPFLIPIGILGILHLFRLKNKKIMICCVCLHFLLGITSFLSLKTVELPPGQTQLIFCERETPLTTTHVDLKRGLLLDQD